MEITEFTYLDPSRLDAVSAPANGTEWLMLKAREEVFSEDGAVKYVSAAARRKYAESGVAMPNGDFPIPDEGHLRSAIGHLGDYKGDRAAAKRHIIARARALHLTHLLPDDWHVSKDVPAGFDGQTNENHPDAGPVDCDDAHDAGRPPAAPYRQERPSETDGTGDTAPDKHLPTSEALCQTRAVKDVDLTGDKAPGGIDEEEREARSQTAEVEGARDSADDADRRYSEANAGDQSASKADPGSPEWEDRDVDLAAQTVAHLQAALECAREFEAREKAEAKKKPKKAKKATLIRSPQAIRAAVEAIEALTGGLRTVPTSKELEHMTQDELIKLLDERDEARRARKAAKAAKNEKSAKKAAKKAAGGEAESADLGATLAGLSKALESVQAQVAEIATQEARPRPLVNDAGLPVLRGGSGEGAFKALEDRVANARNTREETEARRQLAMAKMIANENARHRNPALAGSRFGQNATPLLTSHSLADDPTVQGIG